MRRPARIVLLVVYCLCGFIYVAVLLKMVSYISSLKWYSLFSHDRTIPSQSAVDVDLSLSYMWNCTLFSRVLMPIMLLIHLIAGENPRSFYIEIVTVDKAQSSKIWKKTIFVDVSNSRKPFARKVTTKLGMLIILP